MSCTGHTVCSTSACSECAQMCVSVTMAFRAKNRLHPVLQTQYVPQPILNTTLDEYRPGYRRILPVSTFVPISVPYTFTVKTDYGELSYTSTAIQGSYTIEPWNDFSYTVFTLFGNDPVILGTLISLTDTQTGILYLKGSSLPCRNATFTPNVSFT
jgi:hypothetical protein